MIRSTHDDILRCWVLNPRRKGIVHELGDEWKECAFKYYFGIQKFMNCERLGFISKLRIISVTDSLRLNPNLLICSIWLNPQTTHRCVTSPLLITHQFAYKAQTRYLNSLTLFNFSRNSLQRSPFAWLHRFFIWKRNQPGLNHNFSWTTFFITRWIKILK